MSVLVYIESPKGNIKKTGFEVATYAYRVAQAMGSDCKAVVIGKCHNASQIGLYGPKEIVHINSSDEMGFDAKAYTHAIADVALQYGADVVVLAHTADGKALTGRLGVKLGAGNISGVNALPELSNTFTVNKSVYSGKAIVNFKVNTDKKVVSVMGNTLQPTVVGSEVSPQLVSITMATSGIKIIERKTSEGIVPLPEAELVVSAGRGMKGPEHWAIIEELAAALGATTACSRPVADTGWRPHHEHVGQTGVAIRPNLYIAAGISGAIQHLAGVNNSKVIVVINKDAEAPFFKAADYGVIGDLFDVVPRLTEAVKKYKASI
jgi:electron transfer flavoprotein alpha subunit